MARVLVVDDVKFIVQMIASVFQRAGHTVATANDGEEALAKAFVLLPDLVVSDITMPKLDGLDLARRLRADKRTCDVPILLVTSRTDAATLKIANDIGVDDHLAKPFESATLLAKATALLGGYPMTFSLQLVRETAIVTALPEELGAAAADHVKPALEHARTAGIGPIVLDLARASRIDTLVGDALLAFISSFKREGGSVEVVRPRLGVGVRGFLAQITSKLKVHEDLKSARAALQLPADATALPIVPPRKKREFSNGDAPVAEVAAGPAAAAVTRMGAARGVVVEVHPQATIMRVTRPDLDADVFALLHEEVARGPRALLLELPAILSLDDAQLREVRALAAKAAAAGASLRFVNPEAGVATRLESVGLGSLVLRTRPRDAAVTRSSS